MACILTFITEIPTDKNISGVHCVPVLENGNLIMAWDKDEKVLTTIGGRLDKDESINEGLDREAIEEAGIEFIRRENPIRLLVLEGI